MTLDAKLTGSMAEHPMTEEAQGRVAATGPIRRSDWGMDVLLPLIGDEVRDSGTTRIGSGPTR